MIVKWYIENKERTLIALGDDVTDEDMFIALLNRGITIKVGNNNNSIARYRIKSQPEVLKFLEIICKKTEALVSLVSEDLSILFEV